MGVCIQAVAVVAALSALITGMIGWPIVLQSSEPVFDRGFRLALVIMVLTPLPGVVADVRALTAAGLPDDRLKAITQQRAVLAVFSILPIGMAWGLIGDSRSIGTVIAAVLVTAFSIVRDLRPDLAAELGARQRPSAPSADDDNLAALERKTRIASGHKRRREPFNSEQR